LWYRKGRINIFWVKGIPSKGFFCTNLHSCKDLTDVMVSHREIQRKIRSSRNIISQETWPRTAHFWSLTCLLMTADLQADASSQLMVWTGVLFAG